MVKASPTEILIELKTKCILQGRVLLKPKAEGQIFFWPKH